MCDELIQMHFFPQSSARVSIIYESICKKEQRVLYWHYFVHINYYKENKMHFLNIFTVYLKGLFSVTLNIWAKGQTVSSNLPF